MLKVFFPNRVLSGIFGYERGGGMPGKLRKLRNEELHDLHRKPIHN
jgi:hypothetical protein